MSKLTICLIDGELLKAEYKYADYFVQIGKQQEGNI